MAMACRTRLSLLVEEHRELSIATKSVDATDHSPQESKRLWTTRQCVWPYSSLPVGSIKHGKAKAKIAPNWNGKDLLESGVVSSPI
eukprot:scaffold22613_cov42-Attheya_sp.AAC.2